MPVLFVYYVYDNPTYEVANKLICILYLVKSLVFMLSRTLLSSALAESGVRVARRFTNEDLFVRSRSKMLLPRVG